jgi:hypothetical protein
MTLRMAGKDLGQNMQAYMIRCQDTYCNGGSITRPIGMNGRLISPAPARDTMRLNGADATYIGGSIVELLSGQTPKGGVGASTL